MSSNPPQDVATYLAAAGLGLTLGTNLFIGTVTDVSGKIPNNAVFIRGGPGGRPQRTMGETSELRNPLIHIRMRYSKFSDGDAQARAIMDAMRAAVISGYLDVVASQSEPLPLGNDNEGRHLWNLGYELVYEDAA